VQPLAGWARRRFHEESRFLPGRRRCLLAGTEPQARAQAKLIARREFAGYWEYVLDEVCSRSAHPHWSGTALISEGDPIGIGSLMVQEELGRPTVQGKHVVADRLLEPHPRGHGQARPGGRPARALARPVWRPKSKGHVVVSGLASGGPAERRRVQVGDIVIEVASGGRRGLPTCSGKSGAQAQPGSKCR